MVKKIKKKRPLSKKKMLKRLKNLAYKLWRECVLLRFGGKCAICDETHLPNCHHIVPKIFRSLRYDPINGIVLCPRDHKFNNRFSAHKNALWFVTLLVLKMPIYEFRYLIKTMNEEGNNVIEVDINYYENVIKKLEDWKLAYIKEQNGKI